MQAASRILLLLQILDASNTQVSINYVRHTYRRTRNRDYNKNLIALRFPATLRCSLGLSVLVAGTDPRRASTWCHQMLISLQGTVLRIPNPRIETLILSQWSQTIWPDRVLQNFGGGVYRLEKFKSIQLDDVVV